MLYLCQIFCIIASFIPYLCMRKGKQQEEQQRKHPKRESYRLSIGNLRNFYAKVTDFLFMMNILACNK